MKDSLRTALYDQNLTEMTSKYELKEKENLLQQKEFTIQKQTSRQKLIFLIASLIILGLIFFSQYLKNRNELKRKTAEVEAQKARLQAEIEHAEVERLQELESMRTHFFSNISHEFRTPLTLILSPAEQIMKGENKGEHSRFINIIYRNAVRMLDLVNQLLDLSRLESGKAKLRVTFGDLKQFIKTIFNQFESLAKQQQLTMEILLPEEEVVGYFDKDVLEKILVNLLSNAVKFTPAGGLITFKLRQVENGIINIWVGDTGIGISGDHIDHLFEKFLAFSNSDVQSGSGIGLSLVKELTDLHRGEIKVESEEGKGTLFLLSLDISKNEYSSEEIIKDSDTKQNEVSPMANLMVLEGEKAGIESRSLPDVNKDKKPLLLIAEDNDDVRNLIVSICRNQFEILEAIHGKIALEIAKEKIPDIIITDVMMPEMDGMTLCKELKSHESTCHIPVIMLTARNDQSDKLSGLKKGADEYMTKPFHAEELLTRLFNILQHRKVLREHFKKVFHAFTPVIDEVNNMDSVFLNQVKATIEKNMADEKFGVSELANLVNLSRSQLHRKLTALLGHTPNELIRNIRLERAKSLLEQNYATITEIAYECGFNSPAYFAKCYKDYFGQSAGKGV